MNMQVISYPEATGTHNGKAYKGITIAIQGKTKGIARAYLPDEFDEDKGERVALTKMYLKLSKARVTYLNELTRINWKHMYSVMDELEAIGRRIEKEETKQANLRQAIKDEI